MRTVLAALDNSMAARPVLASAHAIGKILHASVTAIHVRVDGASTPRSLAKAAAVPLRVVDGDVVDQLIRAGSADDVAALVIGARGLPTDPRPLGPTALTIAAALAKPVVIVPPDAVPRTAFHRVLAPLEGSAPTSLAPRFLIELAPDAELDVVALHVLGPETLPAFTDQPQHERIACAREFLARYCSWGIDVVRLETRVGRKEELVPLAAEECGCDLIVLGWSQDLTDGHAQVVRATFERSHLPVVLVPVPPAPGVVPASRSASELTGPSRGGR